MVGEAVNKFGKFSGKVSTHKFSHYSPTEDYSLIVIYKKDGDLKFSCPTHAWGGRFFHVSIQKVADWPAGSVHDRAGQGLVHDYHHKEFTGLDHRSGRICAAGGAIRSGQIMCSSAWLNPPGAPGCNGDGRREMSSAEKAFVEKLVNHWMRSGSHVLDFEASFIKRHCGSRAELDSTLRGKTDL
eukprot:gb/GFBE01071723.1/.p1 GENE.gb/GFBE01071723.1/~~gb/GFBE01071723.1/.p1  ORF type:complete len:184 (+),score=25.55 gb/GFBE01071723.1/:1-552(+)